MTGRFGLKFLKKIFVPLSGSLGKESKLTVSENIFFPLPAGGICWF